MTACIVDLTEKKGVLNTDVIQIARKIAELTTTLSNGIESEASAFEGLQTLMQRHMILVQERKKICTDLAAAEETFKKVGITESASAQAVTEFSASASAPAHPEFSATNLQHIIGRFQNSYPSSSVRILL